MIVQLGVWQFRAVEFRIGPKAEPLSQLLHCLYIYPQSVNLSKKRNLFVRLELRKDDGDIRKPPLEVCGLQFTSNYQLLSLSLERTNVIFLDHPRLTLTWCPLSLKSSPPPSIYRCRYLYLLLWNGIEDDLHFIFTYLVSHFCNCFIIRIGVVL